MPRSISDHIMLLAAGLGTRLRPLTLTVPKPLVTLGDGTLLDYHLGHIKAAGFSKAIINTHYLAPQIVTHLEKQACLPYALSHEEILLGSGGGIGQALHHFDGPFFVVNSDTYTPNNLSTVYAQMRTFFDAEKMDVLLLLTPLDNIRGYEGVGDFLCRDKDGMLTLRGDLPSAPYVYLGIQILKPELFKNREGVFSIFPLWQKAQQEGRFFGLIHKDFTWFDMGNPHGLSFARDNITLDQVPCSLFSNS